MTIPLPPRPKRRRNETRDITRPLEAAINRIPGARVVRNNNLGPVCPWAKRHDPAFIRPIVAGLGAGSADLVGLLCVRAVVAGAERRIGQAIAIECKRFGRKQSDDQRRWAAAFQRLGGLYLIATSVEETVTIVRQHVDAA